LAVHGDADADARGDADDEDDDEGGEEDEEEAALEAEDARFWVGSGGEGGEGGFRWWGDERAVVVKVRVVLVLVGVGCLFPGEGFVVFGVRVEAPGGCGCGGGGVDVEAGVFGLPGGELDALAGAVGEAGHFAFSGGILGEWWCYRDREGAMGGMVGLMVAVAVGSGRGEVSVRYLFRRDGVDEVEVRWRSRREVEKEEAREPSREGALPQVRPREW
jgi:hypothetical protein